MSAPNSDYQSEAGILSLRFRRFLGRALTTSFESLRETAPGRLLQNRLNEQREYSETEIEFVRGDPKLEGLRIAYLSDMHAGFYLPRAELGRIGARVAELEPDLVCYGGDFIATHRRNLQEFDELLERLDPPLGSFAVPGNHDIAYLDGLNEGVPALRQYLADRRVRLLVNEGLRLEHRGASFWLGGVDDAEQGTMDFDLALEGRRTDEATILLAHHPDAFVRAAELGVDLQLSGHTHGGQIRIFGWAPITHSRHGYFDGAYRRGNSTLYVGRGVGVSALPIRIGARSEVPLFRISIRAPRA